MFISKSLKFFLLEQIEKLQKRVKNIEYVNSNIHKQNQVKISYEDTGVTVKSESVNISAPVIKVREKNNDLCDEFNEIMNVDVRVNITKAFCTLDSNLKKGLLSAKCEEERKNILWKKARECKEFLNDYIDSNVRALIRVKEDGE